MMRAQAAGRAPNLNSNPSARLGGASYDQQANRLGLAMNYLRAGLRWLERKRATQASSRRMRIRETISLGEKRTVSILQVDGLDFLIGSSTAGVQLLSVLNNRQPNIEPGSGGRQL